jgi:hypothetical protein
MFTAKARRSAEIAEKNLRKAGTDGCPLFLLLHSQIW